MSLILFDFAARVIIILSMEMERKNNCNIEKLISMMTGVFRNIINMQLVRGKPAHLELSISFTIVNCGDKKLVYQRYTPTRVKFCL